MRFSLRTFLRYSENESRWTIIFYSACAFGVTGLIYITGTTSSFLHFLYLPLSIGAAIKLERKEALAVGLLGTVLYSLLVGLILKDYLPQFDGTAPLFIPRGGLLPQVLGLLSANSLVAVATNYLVTTTRSHQKIAEQSQQEIIILSQEQQNLIDELQESVVATTIEGVISKVNKSFVKLFNVAEKDLVGENLLSILRSRTTSAVPTVKTLLALKELRIKEGNSSRTLSISGKVLTKGSGEESGYLLLVRDITEVRSLEEKVEIQEKMARLLTKEQRSREESDSPIPEFIGETPLMKKVFSLIERVAPTEATVLINGESGTGKELVARAIHQRSTRASQVFIPVNCGAIPETLLESELFGHKKGAFTGAVSDHQGLFRQASGGTLFLDEVGELPLHLQSKLLRALQERCVRPVGADHDISIDVRIIAATNRDLRHEMKKGTFREDLYYRLNVISIALPALRERKEDIPLLVQAFLEREKEKRGRSPFLPPATLQALMAYNYPGNVRELENILERGAVLGGEALLLDHLPEYITNPQSNELVSKPETIIIEDSSLELPLNLDLLLQSIEKRYLLLALEKSQGVKKKAAELLGMNFRSIRYRLQKFGIEDKEE